MRNTSVIMTEAMNCLIEKMGIVETEIFISNIIKEPFDYTEWQRQHFDNISLEDINKQAVQYCKNNKDQGTP